MLIFYIGAFFVSLSTLLLEVSLARIFSVTMWYHFAFMIVSIALFGFGASGAFLTIFRGILKKDKNKVAMFLTSILSIVIILSMLIISRVPLDLFQISDNPLNLFKMFLYYLILAIPFFMSGLYSVYLFSIFPEKTGKIYFLNLVGSGIGCIAVVFIIPLFSNAGAIICASIFVMEMTEVLKSGITVTMVKS